MEAIFIAIIVGIIGLIANKKKLEKPNHSKQVPNPMSLFGNVPKKSDEVKVMKNTPVKVHEVVEKKDRGDIIYRDEELDAEIQSDRFKIQEEYYQRKLELTNKQVETIKKLDSPLNLSDRTDMVKGIILAEVLGPPRSKKPYSRK